MFSLVGRITQSGRFSLEQMAGQVGTVRLMMPASLLYLRGLRISVALLCSL